MSERNGIRHNASSGDQHEIATEANETPVHPLHQQKNRPDRYIRAGFVNPELYDIEIKELVPRPHPSMPGFLVRDGKDEYHGYVAVHDLYMAWPGGRGPRARMTAHRA
jgi:hypothetical protein